MISVLQRVSRARVTVAGEVVGAIGHGLLAFVGAVQGDDGNDLEYTAKRIATLRIFADQDGRMNLAVPDAGAAVLVVSQFTLAADTRKGRRPSFLRALAPELAEPMIAALMERLRDEGLDVQGGRFGAHMDVELLNDGPVTIVLDSREARRG